MQDEEEFASDISEDMDLDFSEDLGAEGFQFEKTDNDEEEDYEKDRN